MSTTKQKGRYFTGLVYPESAPADWKKQLKNTHLAFAISPLHTPDDEEKKPHWHVIYDHSQPCTVECALRAIPEVFANNHLEIVHAPRNMQRYLIHLDDEDKQQFAGGAKEIEILNGFPLDLSRDFSKAELQQQRAQIFDFILENNVLEYSDLLIALFDLDCDLFDFACNHTILFNTFLTSRRNRAIGC